MFKENSIIYLDGEYKKLSDSSVSPLTHSLHYGSGAFEGIRAYKLKKGTSILKLEEHIDRLFYSATRIGMEIKETKEEIIQIIINIMKKNNLESAYIRPLTFYDHSSLGVATKNNKVILMIAAWEWGKYLSESVRVVVSQFRRISEKSTFCDAKISGHYVNSILAKNKALKDGYDEALLLDHEDNIAEGTGENIFFIKGKELHTPKLGKILAGITRKLVIEISTKLGYEIIERDIKLSELKDFDGAFFTGTAAEVSPISEITNTDGNKFIFDLNYGKDIRDKFFYLVSEDNEDIDGNFTLVE